MTSSQCTHPYIQYFPVKQTPLYIVVLLASLIQKKTISIMMPFESNTTINHNNGIASATFESFLKDWLLTQQHHLDELLLAQQHHHQSPAEDLKDLLTRVVSHYHQYYQEKSRLASRNVFLVFSPFWLTPLERTFLWIAGFNPGLIFRLVAHSVHDLEEEQRQRMRELKGETRREERLLANQLARIQESVAEPSMLELARQYRRDGEIGDADAALETLRSAMEAVLGGADSLRTRTVERVMNVLSPVQNLNFLTAATKLQLQIRRLGLQKETERDATNGQ